MKSIAALGLSLAMASCAVWHEPIDTNGSPQAQGQSFRSFLIDLEAEAIARGLPSEKIRASYGTTPPAPLPEARKAEKSQAEFNGNLSTYLMRAVSPARVQRGIAFAKQHIAILKQIEKREGIPANLLVALWGMESDYGRNAGSMPLIPTLASMAYKSPRHAMFRSEVFAALQLENAETLKGSWAGATGQCQFMPSNVLKHATDGNADGQIDIWGTEADVFASTARFMKALGYQPGKPWRIALNKAPELNGITINGRGLSEPLSLQEWRQRGAKGKFQGFGNTEKFRAYQPDGPNGTTYLTTPNYEAVLGWNYSSFFATSVFTLAEAIRKGGH